MDELGAAAKIVARKLANKAIGATVPSMSPFDAAPETLKSVGELADTVDAPRKYFLDKAFKQMDVSKSITGQETPGIEYAKGAVDMILPSAYDLVPGSKNAAKAAKIVERKTAAKALQEAEPGLLRTIVKPTAQEAVESRGFGKVKWEPSAQDLAAAKAASNKPIMPTKERSTAQIILERQAQKPVSVVQGKTIQSTISGPTK